MICPRMSQPSPQGSVQNINPVICQEEECALWHARDKACADLLAADALTFIQASLNLITQQMPQ